MDDPLEGINKLTMIDDSSRWELWERKYREKIVRPWKIIVIILISMIITLWVTR